LAGATKVDKPQAAKRMYIGQSRSNAGLGMNRRKGMMMKMTTQKPTKPGWYWYELPGSWPLQPALVFDGGIEFDLMYTLDAVDDDHDDSDRDGLELHKATPNTIWSTDPIETPQRSN
jgi:hypothetical protein